jgi:hypothetical protein
MKHYKNTFFRGLLIVDIILLLGACSLPLPISKLTASSDVVMPTDIVLSTDTPSSTVVPILAEPTNTSEMTISTEPPALPTELSKDNASDPNYVYQQVKLAVANKDVSYLEEFFDGTFEINYSKLEACTIMPDWKYPPLEVISEHMLGELTCQGIQYESNFLTIYYTGWNPPWLNCLHDGDGSVTAGFKFTRSEPGEKFILDRIQTSSMEIANLRCCGHTGYNPYNAISCDVDVIPDIEQDICPNALPQRMRIAGKGVVCKPEGVLGYGLNPAGIGESNDYVTVLPFGEELSIISGPHCIGDGQNWYYIDSESGWNYVSEGTNEEGYAICPMDENWEQIKRTITPEAANYCPGSPPQRLVVNGRGMVCPSITSLRLRSAPGIRGKQIASLEGGTKFTVTLGPVCAGNDWSWWKIRTDSGLEGWVAEGGDATDPYYLCPID